MAQLKIDVIVDDHGAAQKLQQVESSVKGVEAAAGTSASAVQKHSSAMSSWSTSAKSFLANAASMYVALGADRLVGVLVEAVSETFRMAGALTDMSAKTGLSTSMLQKLDYVGSAAGVTIENFSNAAFQLGVRLGQGSKGVVGAVKELGLDFEVLKSMGPDQQLQTILSALSHVDSQQDRNRLGVELFGRTFKSIAASVTSDYDSMANAAVASGEQQLQAIDRMSDKWDQFVKNQKSSIAGWLGSLVLVSEELNRLSRLSSKDARANFAEFAKSGETLEEFLVRTSGKTQGKDINLPLSGLKPQTSSLEDIRTGSVSAPRKTAAQIAAEKEAIEMDRLSGRTAIEVAETWMDRVARLGGITKLAAKDQEAFNKALDESLDAMIRLNGSVDPKTFDMWVKSMQVKVTQGLPGALPGTAAQLPSATGFYGNLLPQAVQGLPGGLPGTSADLSNINPLADVGFFKQAFGTGKQLGAQLGQAILGGIQGGWKGIVGNVGSMLGGNIGGQLGGMLSQMGGFLGGLGGMLGPLGSMLGGLAGNLIGKLFGPSEYEKRVRAEEQQRQELKASLNMEEMQRQAAFTGRQDLVTGVVTGLQTKNDPEYLRGLVTELNDKTQELTAAMQRYGISWEELGSKAKQSQIDEMAKQFITDFKVLNDAGASTDLIIQKMSGSVNEFIQTAIRTGTEVPIAMQPMVQKMADMGLLVDQTGAQLEVSSLNWSMTMTQGFQSVAEAINHLAQALGYELPAAAARAANGINSELSRVNVGGYGGFSQRAAEYNEPRSSGGTGGVTVYVDASDSLVHSDDLSERIAESVAPFLPGAVESYGV